MHATISAPLLTSFAPVVNDQTETLILGSFPGKASLTAQQYYAHPQNQFWRLLSSVLDDDLTSLAYADKLDRLLSYRIGLWDVIAACAREGSLDSAIRFAQTNDFTVLRQHCPALRRVCFNGKTSGKQAAQFAAAGFDTLLLPSSSPAYAVMRFEEKLVHWRGIIAQS